MAKEQWERDIKNIAAHGFEFVHLAEFAWAMLEPKEGEYAFEWLDDVVEMCHQQGMKVVLCSPSATPPVWMARKYPEILIVQKDGTVKDIGHRQHGSPSSDKFRELTYKYLEAIGKHFANDERILGWQLDNEPKGWADYSQNAEKRFRKFVENKYGTIDALNKAWGTAFWSMTYPDFESVKIPTLSGNPHHQLDWKRFQSGEMTSFMAEQKEVLEKFIPENQWVTTNFIPNIGNIDPKASKSLDFICYTRYLAHGYTNGTGDRGFRRGYYLDIPFSSDYHRPFKRTTGVMELQPGQVNWGNNYNPQVEPKTVRMWLWHTYAGGADFACTYRYRQPLYGSEQYHYGVVGTDGVTLSTGGEDFVTFMDEIKSLRKKYNPQKTENSLWNSRQAAILMSYDNRWETNLQKQTKQWSQTGHIFSHYYKWLKSFASPVDFISEEDDFSKYPLLIAPAYQLLDEKLVEKWEDYVKDGGHLVLSVRTGQKDRTGILWEGKWAEPIHGLIGGEINFFDLLPKGAKSKVAMGEDTFTWNIWGDILMPHNGTAVWATYAEEFYQGKAAVLHRKLGKGTVTYVGVASDGAELEKAVLKKIYSMRDIGIESLPEGISIECRDGFWIAVNYGSEPYTLNIPNGSEIILGEKIVGRNGVTVWR